ncbi:hypothetical protein OsI_20088 [Oryza sativa Indica Group]|uniref:Reverse transcriptase zinc-binding domain-containing protein n=1 Tax=Oryza sativa subsp. indica TaxID=39946 RepID=B8AYJ9_ORYSI|nr:hypothetical protein OsI_20087 [Oryza sativa Indica Group]EEC79286.1 hypothetical protein OsI_20088 [Oryza sativa Indica Group]
MPVGFTRRPITPRGNSILTKVVELIDPGTGWWDEQLVNDLFWPEDAATILATQVDENLEDWPTWHFDSKGLFSVKSAYKLAVQIREKEKCRDASGSSLNTSHADTLQWEKIWNMEVPNKIKMFVWRLAHNSLPVRCNIRRRGMESDNLCPMCNRFDEDCGHLFLKCKGVKECWRSLNLEEVRLRLVQCQSGKETVKEILSMTAKDQLKAVVLLWKW